MAGLGSRCSAGVEDAHSGPGLGGQGDQLRRLVLHLEQALLERLERGHGARAVEPQSQRRVRGGVGDDAGGGERGDQLLAGGAGPVDAHAHRRGLVVGVAERRRLVRAQPRDPAAYQPRRVRGLDREALDGVVGQGDLAVVGDLAQDRVDEARRPAEAQRLGDLDRLAHRGVAGHAGEVEQLVGADAQRHEHAGLELAQRALAVPAEDVVERKHPAGDAVAHLGGQGRVLASDGAAARSAASRARFR